MNPCPKILGADFELANAVENQWRRDGNVGEAARKLLDEIHGYPRERGWGGTVIEWGRRFLSSNGGSAYIDSDHLEINVPEHLRAADHALHIHAGLQIARDAQVAATRKLPGGARINVTAAVSDGHESWGHHLNVMVRRELFNDMFSRKPHLAGWLATHLATSVVYTGHGHVGASNDRPACDYQLSQRADWFEEFVGHQTTHRRPILNMRDESHAHDGLARMHIIYFDNVLCPIANLLKAGTTQLVLAMAEAGWADPVLQVDDPLEAALRVSRDLTLKQQLVMAARGKLWSAVDVQRAYCDLAGEFVASGEVGDTVADAEHIVQVWRETLDMLAKRDLGALARRCDWALKFLLLERQRGRRGVGWDSPDLKALDFIFSSLDPQEGLFWQMAQAGLVEDLPKPETIERYKKEPPDDTRAYLRAHALRKFGEHVVDMDWDRIRFRVQSDRYWWSETALMMQDPMGFNRAATESVIRDSASLAELIQALGSEPRSMSSGYHASLSGPSDYWGQRSGGYEPQGHRRGRYGW